MGLGDYPNFIGANERQLPHVERKHMSNANEFDTSEEDHRPDGENGPSVVKAGATPTEAATTEFRTLTSMDTPAILGRSVYLTALEGDALVEYAATITKVWGHDCVNLQVSTHCGCHVFGVSSVTRMPAGSPGWRYMR